MSEHGVTQPLSVDLHIKSLKNKAGQKQNSQKFQYLKNVTKIETFNTMLITISVLKLKVFFKNLNLIMESLLYFLIKLKKSFSSYQNIYEALVKLMHNLRSQG